MDLSTPVSKLYMVGPIFAKRLSKLGIKTVEDLIYHFPHRYEDFSLVSDISRVQPGETLTIKGQVLSIKNEYTRSGKKIQKAEVADSTDKIEIVWFNQPFLVKTIKVGEWYNLSGKVDWFGRNIVMVSPEYELLRKQITEDRQQKAIHTGRLVPIYPETYGVSSKWLRSRIAPLLEQILPSINDFLPKEITQTYNLLNLPPALRWIHFPENKIQAEQARNRLAFDELFLIQLAGLKRKQDWQKKTLSNKFFIDQEKVLDFIHSLPFELTGAQKRSLREILANLAFDKPMNRLLEGDVGSGKTVVAAIAVYIAYLNGFRSVLMAPTEILANQHYQTLNQLLSPFGIKIALLTGSKKHFPLPTSHFPPNVYIGTHALIQKGIKFENLGLVIIDEQHRFGVEQRGELIKKGSSPHILTMTATPIPRTIALTLYGDLDLSVLDEMPPGRQRIKTWVVPPIKRQPAYNWIRQRVKGTSEQAFIICPLIEESETLKSIKAATVEFENLSKKIFPDLKLGLLHGRLKSKEKDEVIDRFRQGTLDVLVSTPVVEVGIDIPQATIMMIEAADRFGLAQLHQLRGRVGRSVKQSFCLLFTEVTEGRAIQRLKAMEKMYIGAELAELDLKLRGPGEIYGTAQHGFPDLRVASFTDLGLIKQTRQAAESVIDKLNQFPALQEKLKRFTLKPIEPN
ncbi:MAG: ATP-dependent DNA helicase RecG [Patescibacteria group bacterium]